ncbi:hypothetical protein PF005_g1717 [Phytophthora fragariae]|uniref:Uncharacterized protein n=2 Tax=Phytophthora TaxID=4783 RepID=A0A6A3TV73_9STRA|nr:hypothetical protein PF003_g16637 [Phytophthora fragariae]KAE9019394.1 hypothetical protein PR002_g12821 [Phytophthora rubi]KAE8947417.1 hypothetical protein PF009_g2996 [Phytophthora fragariae]KAE9000905.1 hypothetical protein PF011_g13980 [Phytophthora fragariae]KAE9105893.1 hypothetical protein PF010_g12826 [Phytophthora fragariae]
MDLGLLVPLRSRWSLRVSLLCVMAAVSRISAGIALRHRPHLHQFVQPFAWTSIVVEWRQRRPRRAVCGGRRPPILGHYGGRCGRILRRWSPPRFSTAVWISRYCFAAFTSVCHSSCPFSLGLRHQCLHRRSIPRPAFTAFTAW